MNRSVATDPLAASAFGAPLQFKSTTTFGAGDESINHHHNNSGNNNMNPQHASPPPLFGGARSVTQVPPNLSLRAAGGPAAILTGGGGDLRDDFNSSEDDYEDDVMDDGDNENGGDGQNTMNFVSAHVSSSELANIRRIFNQFDADNSNSIDLGELREVMASLGVLMEESHLAELAEQVTAGGKKDLTFDEFLNLITLWKEASQYKLFDGNGFKSLAQQHVEEALRTTCFVSDSPRRAAWDCVVCAAAVLYWIWVLLLDAYTYRAFDAAGLIVCDIVLTIVLFIDAVVCAQTCYVESGGVLIDDRRRVFLNFVKTTMFIDVLAVFPFDLVLSIAAANIGGGGSGTIETAATVLRHLRLLKLFKIPLLWAPSGHVPITARYIQFHFHALPIVLLLIVFVCIVHGLGVGWILLKQSTCTDTMFASTTTFDGAISESRCVYRYTPAVYFVLYSLTTVGLGDVPVNGISEQWYSSGVLIIAMATNGIVIGKLVAILQRADIKRERREKLRETLAVLEHFSIPTQLQAEILQFQAHVFEHNLGAAYEDIVSGLPLEMRANISLFVKMKLVTSVPLFFDAHYMLRIAVAQNLENAVARPEQYIVVTGEPCGGLYFLAYGFADVFAHDGQYSGTLRSGDYFGEAALVGEAQQRVSAKAITYCDLWILRVQTFAALLRRFPKFSRFVEDLRLEQVHQRDGAIHIGEEGEGEADGGNGGKQKKNDDSKHGHDNDDHNENRKSSNSTESAAAGINVFNPATAASLSNALQQQRSISGASASATSISRSGGHHQSFGSAPTTPRNILPPPAEDDDDNNNKKNNSGDEEMQRLLPLRSNYNQSAAAAAAAAKEMKGKPEGYEDDDDSSSAPEQRGAGGQLGSGPNTLSLFTTKAKRRRSVGFQLEQQPSNSNSNSHNTSASDFLLGGQQHQQHGSGSHFSAANGWSPLTNAAAAVPPTAATLHKPPLAMGPPHNTTIESGSASTSSSATGNNIRGMLNFMGPGVSPGAAASSPSPSTHGAGAGGGGNTSLSFGANRSLISGFGSMTSMSNGAAHNYHTSHHHHNHQHSHSNSLSVSSQQSAMLGMGMGGIGGTPTQTPQTAVVDAAALQAQIERLAKAIETLRRCKNLKKPKPDHPQQQQEEEEEEEKDGRD